MLEVNMNLQWCILWQGVEQYDQCASAYLLCKSVEETQPVTNCPFCYTCTCIASYSCRRTEGTRPVRVQYIRPFNTFTHTHLWVLAFSRCCHYHPKDTKIHSQHPPSVAITQSHSRNYQYLRGFSVSTRQADIVFKCDGWIYSSIELEVKDQFNREISLHVNSTQF